MHKQFDFCSNCPQKENEVCKDCELIDEVQEAIQMGLKVGDYIEQ